MSLFNESGHSSRDDRNAEAIRLVDELYQNIALMHTHERNFVSEMSEKIANGELFCSAKQLFWLRDLYEKYCF